MLEHIIPFALFVAAMTGTPGPGNLAMLAIGQNGGYRAALPFLMGAVLGFLSLNCLVGFGLGEIFATSPVLSNVVKVLGLAYIIYLGAKILRLQLREPDRAGSFSLWEGLMVHPLSPKSWAMSLVAFGQFSDPGADLVSQALLFAGVFLFGQFLFHSLWCLAGAGILKLLRGGRVLQAVNACVALLMVSSTAWALFL